MIHETEIGLMYIIVFIALFLDLIMFIYTYYFIQPHFSKGEKKHIYLIRFINLIVAIFCIIIIVFISYVPIKK